MPQDQQHIIRVADQPGSCEEWQRSGSDREVWATSMEAPKLGDWVETDQGEIGEVTSLFGHPSLPCVEVCVGRCFREMPLISIATILSRKDVIAM